MSKRIKFIVDDWEIDQVRDNGFTGTSWKHLDCLNKPNYCTHYLTDIQKNKITFLLGCPDLFHVWTE